VTTFPWVAGRGPMGQRWGPAGHRQRGGFKEVRLWQREWAAAVSTQAGGLYPSAKETVHALVFD